eukprot:m.843922 g.843922  ORF g.843922 m.843922 type:complete len:239 (+) comp59540_c0_seq5:2081-2797(+)
MTAVEASSELLRAKRHTLLKECKVDEVALPFKKGSLKDVVADDTTVGTDSASQPGEMDTAVSDGKTARRIEEKESGIELDYRTLPSEMKKLEDAAQLGQALQQFVDKMAALSQEIESMAPNMKAVDRFDEVRERLKSSGDEFQAVSDALKNAEREFASTKEERSSRFNHAFSHIEANIDGIYKALTKSGTHDGGCVNLTPRIQTFVGDRLTSLQFLFSRRMQGPYLQGIKYIVTPLLK